MNCSVRSSAPVGARGILVGKLNATTCQVVFDRPFIGGGDLGGRCSELRGRNVPLDTLLNLTRPVQRMSRAPYRTKEVSISAARSSSSSRPWCCCSSSFLTSFWNGTGRW